VKILAVAGASGGHIFPALEFLDTLRDKHKDIEALLVLPRKSLKDRINILGYNVSYISITSIKLRISLKNLVTIFNFLKGTCESLIILVSFKPDVVVGFGSLVSLPMLLFAWLLRTKTLIHEQNVIPGRANRFLAKFVDKIAVSFEQTKGYLRDCSSKIIITGNPLRRQLEHIDKNKALDFFNLNGGKTTILVMGGSQGSRRINSGFLAAIAAMPGKEDLQVIHLTGAADIDSLKDGYKELDVTSRLFDFLEPMQYAYSASDLVVCRAGAITIAEIIFFRLPAIIIPYPFAYEHQTANARVLKEKNCGIILKDGELDGGSLNKSLQEIINPDRLKEMRSCYKDEVRLNANDLLVRAALSF
jgi:UDP-N-acetylglucosamine--N-acetylmuramyl-(pentapeptide) pyrophosphoryl-undecaprenol N-acetylglucosamine transferase